MFVRRLTTQADAERAAMAHNPFGTSNPLEIIVVARMKHCSILALDVLCSAAFYTLTVRRGAEERDASHD